MTLKIFINIILISGLFWRPCYASDVFYIDNSQKKSVFEKKLELVCRFYGLEVERLLVGEGQSNLLISDKVRNGLAIVITDRALLKINKQKFVGTIGKKGGGNIPMLVINVTPKTDANLLNRWSGGSLMGCIESNIVPLHGFYKVADLRDITLQLAGQLIPFSSEDTAMTYRFILNNNEEAQAILEIASDTKDILFPIFVKTNVDGRKVFFLVDTQPSISSEESSWKYINKSFFEIAPVMIFLRYACGDRCWHSPGYYANLTIDDPWLIEPYGHLSYRGLLSEMEKANFHTTIAFIPWNFDRSKPEVASLFRNHPDRFSISIHGNNHDHREFYKYKTSVRDPWPAKPLNDQEADIIQALARIDEFKRLTGLHYDRIMVFPHGIAPAKTLGVLKKYNFLATSNAGNIPLGSEAPPDELFELRPVTLEFENFASLNRFSAEGKTKAADIAKDLFFGKPLLFYGHHGLFKNGIDAFDKTSQLVNNIQPNIEWKNLGYITRHLYLQKKRSDGNYDIRLFSRRIELENIQKLDVTYFVRKEESFSPPIRQVTVDGAPYPYKRSGSNLSLTIDIPAGKSRLIDIEYANDLDLTSIDISKNDPRINRLRKLSDFRDIILSKNVFGRAVINAYYEMGVYKLGLKRLAILFLLLFAIGGYSGWYLRKRYKKHRL